MSRLRNNFLTGLVLMVPIVLTVWILQLLLGVLDNFSQPLLSLYVGRPIPGAGAVLTAAIILLLGFFSKWLVGRRVFAWFEAQVDKIPFVRSLYSTTRQVVRGFSSSEGVNFKRVVFVHREDGSLAVGFVTREFELDGRPTVAVYVPTNHLYLGDVCLLAPEQLTEVDLSLEDGISAVLSCGGSMPDAVARLASAAIDGTGKARALAAPAVPSAASSAGGRGRARQRGSGAAQ